MSKTNSLLAGYLSGGLGGYIKNGVWDESEARHRAKEYARIGAAYGASMGLGHAWIIVKFPGAGMLAGAIGNYIHRGRGTGTDDSIWSGPIKDFGYGEHYQKNWYDFFIKSHHTLEDRQLIRSFLIFILYTHLAKGR